LAFFVSFLFNSHFNFNSNSNFPSVMSTLPHVFVPSNRAVQQTLCAHPSGPLELFMVACNLETDIKLDERLAGTGYCPARGTKTIKKEEEVEEKNNTAQFAFSVPLTPNPAAAAAASVVRVKQEPRD